MKLFFLLLFGGPLASSLVTIVAGLFLVPTGPEKGFAVLLFALVVSHAWIPLTGLGFALYGWWRPEAD